MAEWLNASVLKTGVLLQVPRVRIPLFPLDRCQTLFFFFNKALDKDEDNVH